MIGAISLMRRRHDIGPEQFSRHWLDVHGPLVLMMPGLQRYQQAHVIAALSAPARVMAVDGFAQLFFRDVAARTVAYASAELAACDRDSPLFIGLVTRLVTEPEELIAGRGAVKLMLLYPPGEAPDTAALRGPAGLVGATLHAVRSQGAAPHSAVAELVCPLCALAEMWFADEAAARAAAARFPNTGTYLVREHEFI
jgi:uncharacterized protein (TIGR02118 family)